MKKAFGTVLGILFWIVLWQILSTAIGKEILFPSPLAALSALFRLARTLDFWKNIGITFLRILAGITLSALLGTVLGALSFCFPPAAYLLDPAARVIKSAPIASFVVLLVLWLKRGIVPFVIAALIVFPVFYAGTREGLGSADGLLKKMLRVFRVPFKSRLYRFYLPTVKPYLKAAAASSFGLAWKAGVAAEVIVLPVLSIGRQLYYASSNLETADVFAWTIVVILLSLLMDRLISAVFGAPQRKGPGHDKA